jgi:hypothetical protein
MKLAHVILATAVLVLTGCASSGGPRKVTHEEASAFERSLMARTKKPTRHEPIYTQPVNKSEPCRLPSSQEQLDRPKFRAYWDGDCKNGFANGLGRDIAISDTHHVEEITIHDGTGSNWSQPRVFYDFVNNSVSYRAGGAKEPADTMIRENYINSVSGFSVSQLIVVVDESGNSSILSTSPFHTERLHAFTNIDGSFDFRFSDNTAAPAIDPNTATRTFSVSNPKTNTRGGFSIIGYGNGQFRHFRMVNGEFGEVVTLPVEYTSHIYSVYQKVRESVAGAIPVLKSSQQIEREYLFKVCNGKGSIPGLDQAAYSKVCTWRDQFKEPYAAASARFQQQLESMKAQATTAEQQRQVQQQIAVQQQMLQKQQDQQAWNEMMSEISRASEQVRKSTERSMPNTNNWQAPQVQPLSIGRNTAICQTIGSIVMCN